MKYGKRIPSNFTPMLCESATVKDVEKGLFSPSEWTAEIKYDGIRAFITNGKIFNRRGKDITEKFPEFKVALSATRRFDDFIIDGEIVAESGEFNDIVGRIHMKDKLYIKIVSDSNPAKFMAFDFLEFHTNSDKLRTKIEIRNGVLNVFGYKRKLLGVYSVESGRPKQMLKKAKEQGAEGIVLKRKGSRYWCRRSEDWKKVKLFKEVVHSFSKFEEHPKGITIEDGDGRRVVVNGVQADNVRSHIEKHGVVQAEIQFLPQKNSTEWRFPSFRGIVTEANDGSKKTN